MDAEQQRFVDVFRRFMDEVIRQAKPAPEQDLTPLGERVSAHLGVDATTVPVVVESIASHRFADLDIALDELAAAGETIGVTGGGARHHEGLPALIANSHARFGPGPVDYVQTTIGPGRQRRAVAFGVRLFRFDGEPVVLLQRQANPQFGRESAGVELMTADPATPPRLLAEIHRLMQERSVLRGKVVSFEGGSFHDRSAGVSFLERPDVPADDIVLAPGTLERVATQTLDITRLAERLRADGRHLKRGILLYGPPGTGKTLTVRHLVGRAEGVTTVLLTGSSIGFVREAAELARAMQPALVVLEDVDLVAMDRNMANGPQPLLFAILDALDGLDGDADVAFVLTTNRLEVLEPALVERPGRIDLAVEIPLPGPDERRRLFERYARGLALSADAVRTAADRAEGTTGSFAKELMRRAALRAALGERDLVDADLEAALDELLDSAGAVGRRLLGAHDADAPQPGAPAGHPARVSASFGYVAGIRTALD